MKLLVSVKVTQGYQHWKNEFENEESINLRASAGIDVIGMVTRPKCSAFTLYLVWSRWRF